jgi:murein DD-endopeptidase MepM/ murein hydrolase activator NlpD
MDSIPRQLEQRYDKRNLGPGKNAGEFLPIKQSAAPQQPPQNNSKTEKAFSDFFGKRDKDLFLAKKTETGFQIKSKEPLPENVDLKAPIAGEVLQAASLGEGRQMIILKNPDQGLTAQFVHTGQNKVQPGQVVIAGERIAELTSSQAGERASVVFGLRRSNSIE